MSGYSGKRDNLESRAHQDDEDLSKGTKFNLRSGQERIKPANVREVSPNTPAGEEL